MPTLHLAMLGALVASAVFASLFFLRFWQRSGDRFHAFLSAAMLMLAINWSIVAAIVPTGEPHSEIYLLRLAAFLVILAGIVDKNRRGHR